MGARGDSTELIGEHVGACDAGELLVLELPSIFTDST